MVKPHVLGSALAVRSLLGFGAAGRRPDDLRRGARRHQHGAPVRRLGLGLRASSGWAARPASPRRSGSGSGQRAAAWRADSAEASGDTGRLFYGWRIVGAGFGLEALIGALLFHADGSYVVLMREEFGWSRTLFAAAFAMARSESAILGPIQGWLTDRFGPRALMRVGMAIFGLGFILFSRVGSPVEFFLAFFLVAVGAGLGRLRPHRRRHRQLVPAATRPRARLRLERFGGGRSPDAGGGRLADVVRLALGLRCSRGSSSARSACRWRRSSVIVLSTTGSIRTGCRPARATSAAASGESPRQHAPGPLGSTVGAPRASTSLPREAMRTPAFWPVWLGHGSALLVVLAVIVHMVTHVTERLGYTLGQAATVVWLLTVAQIVGHLGGGWAGDRVSKRAIVVGCMVGHAAALLLLAVASAYWMVVAFALLHGLSWGTRGPLMAAIRADYFGSAAFGTISGVSSMVTMLGMVGGPLVAGILADRTGSYRLGFTVLALLAFVGSVFFLLAKRPAPPASRGAACARPAVALTRPGSGEPRADRAEPGEPRRHDVARLGAQEGRDRPAHDEVPGAQPEIPLAEVVGEPGERVEGIAQDLGGRVGRHDASAHLVDDAFQREIEARPRVSGAGRA